MFRGMGKNFWGFRVCFFMDWKVASKIVCQVSLFHTTGNSISSHLEKFCRKDILKTFLKIQGKKSASESLLNKSCRCRNKTLIKKDSKPCVPRHILQNI